MWVEKKFFMLNWLVSNEHYILLMLFLLSTSSILHCSGQINLFHYQRVRISAVAIIISYSLMLLFNFKSAVICTNDYKKRLYIWYISWRTSLLISFKYNSISFFMFCYRLLCCVRNKSVCACQHWDHTSLPSSSMWF